MNNTNKNESENPIRLSFTQIDLYQTCPMHYKFRYILKIRAPRSAAPSFGQVVHDTLQHFYINLMEGRKSDKDTLLRLYDTLWRSEGYVDQMQELSYRRKGGKQLADYYEKNKESLRAPLYVEKNFIYPIDDITIVGKIDRIDSIGENSIELIDYKTGKPKSQKEADKDLQMSIYAIASQNLLPKKKAEKFTFYFLETNEKISSSRTDEQIEETISQIKIVADEIRAKKFDPADGHHCNWCAYPWICPAKQPARL